MKKTKIICTVGPSTDNVELLRKMMPKAHFATIYAKPMGKPMVETFITEVSQDTWIHFPWDVELQFTKPIAEIKQSS